MRDLWLIFCACLVLAGCAGPGYYAQAVSGHYRLMADREDIDDYLQRSDLDPELARELELAREIRAFAVSDLGLPDNESYLQYVETGREAVTWNVVAAPEFSLQPRSWCFPAAGCVPYRGYFSEQKAMDFADKLRAKGYDVSVSGAAAYSTLGWFDDPLTDTMLRYSDEQTAAFIFHELAHQQLYVKGDAAFNEAYAGFVEEAGVRAWLEASGRSERLGHWEDLRRAAGQFNTLLRTTRDQLAALYGSEMAEPEMRFKKAQAFEDLALAYAELVDGQWSGRDHYRSWFKNELNNARLVLISTYQAGSCAFENLFAQSGSDLVLFHRQAAAIGDLPMDERKQWLEQPCKVIAPTPDL